MLTQDWYFIIVMVIVVLVDSCAKISAAGQGRHIIFLNTNNLHNDNRYTANAPEPVPITAVEDPALGFEISTAAGAFCTAIQRLLSVRYVPTGNGVAESAFRVHIPRARAALRACGGCKELYTLSVQHSMWLGNRQWSKQLGGCPFDRVPHPPPVVHEQFMDKPFGCRMWAHFPHVNVPH